MEKIIIVEDEAITAMDLQNRLQDIGYTVPAITSTGEEAVELADSIKPDLILMDIMLKGEMDGTIAADQIAQKHEIPIVFLTAYSDKDTYARAKKSSPYAYLTKPFNTIDLSNAIDLALYKHKMVKEIMNAKKRYHAVVDNASIGIIVHSNEGVICELNRTAHQILGVNSETAIGKNLKKFIPENEIDYFEIKLNKLIKEEKSSISIGHIIQTNGKARDIEMLTTKVRLNGDYILFSLINDVTEKNEFLLQTQFNDKLAAIGTLAAGIIHEINNPLSAAFISLELASDNISNLQNELKNKELPEKEILELAELTNISIKSLTIIKQIVKDLKGFGRKDDFKRLLRAQDIIESSINITHPQFRHIAQIKIEYAESMPDLYLPADKIQQVLVNLLINASQAFEKTENYDTNLITLSTKYENNQVMISVSDTGMGIPENIINTIFEPFFTTKPSGVGTGLGLSISKDIITSLGGTLTVTSRIDEGTTFTITLPIKLKVDTLSESDKQLLEKLNIMIIDNGQMIANMLMSLIEHRERITIPANGKEAIKLLNTQRIFPDIIICDLTMPDIDGTDIYYQLEKINSPIKNRIIYIIDAIDKKYHERFISSVSNIFLHKPCTSSSLIEAIKKIHL